MCKTDKNHRLWLQSASAGIAYIKLISSNLVMEGKGEMPWPYHNPVLSNKRWRACVNSEENGALVTAGVWGGCLGAARGQSLGLIHG